MSTPDTTHPHGICNARTGPNSIDRCEHPLDELHDCPQLEKHWEPACPCGNRLAYYTPCPACGAGLPK